MPQEFCVPRMIRRSPAINKRGDIRDLRVHNPERGTTQRLGLPHPFRSLIAEPLASRPDHPHCALTRRACRRWQLLLFIRVSAQYDHEVIRQHSSRLSAPFCGPPSRMPRKQVASAMLFEPIPRSRASSQLPSIPYMTTTLPLSPHDIAPHCAVLTVLHRHRLCRPPIPCR